MEPLSPSQDTLCMRHYSSRVTAKHFGVSGDKKLRSSCTKCLVLWIVQRWLQHWPQQWPQQWPQHSNWGKSWSWGSRCLWALQAANASPNMQKVNCLLMDKGKPGSCNCARKGHMDGSPHKSRASRTPYKAQNTYLWSFFDVILSL